MFFLWLIFFLLLGQIGFSFLKIYVINGFSTYFSMFQVKGNSLYLQELVEKIDIAYLHWGAISKQNSVLSQQIVSWRDVADLATKKN